MKVVCPLFSPLQGQAEWWGGGGDRSVGKFTVGGGGGLHLVLFLSNLFLYFSFYFCFCPLYLFLVQLNGCPATSM